MAERYGRYGLLGNPFTVGPLNPLEDPQDLKRIVRLGKFHLNQIDDALDKCIRAGKPSFFLVSGKDGTGRTSLARYVLARYRDIRQIAMDRFVVPDMKVNHSVEDIFRNWMIYLRTSIRLKRIDIGKELTERLLDDAKKTPATLLNPIFSDLAIDVSQALDQSKPCAAFGVYLEDIPDLELFEAALVIFQAASTVCVMTISESVLANMHKKLPAHFYKLEEIEGADVWEVVENRWIGNQPNPFDQNGVVKAFSPRFPIGRALVLMEKILATKLDYYPSGNQWPEAEELRFSEALIIGQVNTHIPPEWRTARGVL